MAPRVIVVMGVAGAGKTTVGTILARELGWAYHDADELHSPANRDKMRRGIALTDADRAPWLGAVRALVARCLDRGGNAIIGCSALRRSYRDAIAVDPAMVRFVYLRGDFALIRDRLAARQGHFMSPDLLKSQFDTLEEPRNAIVVDVALAPPAIVAAIRAALGL